MEHTYIIGIYYNLFLFNLFCIKLQYFYFRRIIIWSYWLPKLSSVQDTPDNVFNYRQFCSSWHLLAVILFSIVSDLLLLLFSLNFYISQFKKSQRLKPQCLTLSQMSSFMASSYWKMLIHIFGLLLLFYDYLSLFLKLFLSKNSWILS